MDRSNDRQTALRNGLARDGDTNGNASNRSTTTTTQRRHNADGAAAGKEEKHQQQPIVKDTKKTKDGTKNLWATVFKCFSCGKHGHNLPK